MRLGPPLVAAITAIVVVVGCASSTAPSPSPSPSASAEGQRVGGPGWSIALPADLGLAEAPVPPTELTGTWEARDGAGGVRQVTVLVNRETAAALDDYFDRVGLAPGSRIEQEAPVQVARGRATWFRVANAGAPSHDLVLVEPTPGTIVSIAGAGIGTEPLVAIARTLEVEER